MHGTIARHRGWYATVRVSRRRGRDIRSEIISSRENKTHVAQTREAWPGGGGRAWLPIIGGGRRGRGGGSESRASIALDSAVLDRYTGDYQLAPTAVLTVTRKGSRLFAQLTGQPAAEIFAQSEGEFFYKIVEARISFDTDPQGRTTGLVLHQNGQNMSAPRIDAAVAQQIAADTTAKVESQTATPGSEAALRRLIEGIRTDKPNFAEMSPELAEVTRKQLPRLEAAMKQFGAVQSVEFRGVGNQGWDAYDVRHEHGLSHWQIALGAGGIIVGALVSTGP